MAGSWKTFTVPDTSTGTFTADIMLLLTDGSVLVHNGYTTNIASANQWLRLTPDQNGNYDTGSWSGELDMQYARQWFASGVLSDGRVFVIGGEYSNDPSAVVSNTPGVYTDSYTGEVFDPQTNLWTPINKPAAFQFVRGDCNGSVLSDGRVLLGGASLTEPPSTWSNLTAIWDPSDNSWIQAGLEFGAAGSTTKEDPFEEETFSLLPDGSVLAPAVRDTPQAQRYVPSLDEWVTAAPSPVNLAITTLQGTIEYETGPTILHPDGSAFVIGGTGQTAIYTPPPASNPTGLGSWTTGPTFPTDTSASPNWPTLTPLDAGACLLPNGKIVCMAGTTTLDGTAYFSLNPILFEYDSSSTATTLPQLDVQPALPAGNYTWQSCFLLLPTGQLLLSAQSNTLFLYTPDPATSAPNPAWAPANISVPATMVLGHSYTLSGTQINGLSQAVCYGDDCGMATNYPVVQLTNPATGQVVYLRSYDFSTMGVATGTTVPDDVQSCTIDIPSNLATGDWNLVAITNGIPSEIVPVQIAGQDCFFIIDNSTFSVGEIDTYVDAHPPVNAVFNPAFYVVVEGYTPSEMGITSLNLANPPNVPSVPSPFPTDMLIAFAGPVIPQDPTLPPTPQRFTFPFSITFTDDKMFGASATQVTLNASFSAAGFPVSNSGTITLTPNPNPYILHGDQTGTPSEPWYLSQDIRVFQVVASPGNLNFNATIPSTGNVQNNAIAFIQTALTNLRNDTTGTLAVEFNAISQDEDTAVLQLQPNDPSTGYPVYNFALARVRLRDTQSAPPPACPSSADVETPDQPLDHLAAAIKTGEPVEVLALGSARNANNVRVFFRIWQAQQTNAEYNSTTYARATNAEGQPIPVLSMRAPLRLICSTAAGSISTSPTTPYIRNASSASARMARSIRSAPCSPSSSSWWPRTSA